VRLSERLKEFLLGDKGRRIVVAGAVAVMLLLLLSTVSCGDGGKKSVAEPYAASESAAEIEREDKIINDLLSLVKMDRTSADLNISEVDINSLVELIMRRLRPIAQRRDVQLVYESLRPVTASVDEVKLTLALSNLVENAIKYNKEHGFVKVTLDADHQFFTVKVEDSGVGIPEDALEHIYERFYRVDKSRSREIGGTGLGLAITKSAILMHRGSVKVSSIEGEGTDFTVKIPLKYIAV